MTDTPSELMSCREAFEKWETADGYYSAPIRDSNDCYVGMGASERWKAWQAAWNTRAQTKPEPMPWIVEADGTMRPLFPKIDGLEDAIRKAEDEYRWTLMSDDNVDTLLEAARAYLALSKQEG